MDRLKELSEALKKACQEVYGKDLVTVAVFGSWARGTATPASDIDVLLIVENLPSGRGRRLRQFEEVESRVLSARAGIWDRTGPPAELSPVLKTPDEVRLGSPLFLDMTEWCRILWDAGSFFHNYLTGLRDRMRKLGTRRRWVKGGYYWEYKPDLKAGEVVEL